MAPAATAALRATRTAGARASRTRADGLDRLEHLRPDRRQTVGGLQAGAQRQALLGGLRLVGRGELDRVLVGLHHLGGDVRPREALGALARGRAHALAAVAVGGERVQRLADRGGVAGLHEQAVLAVGDDVAVARDVRRHDRSARRERLGQHHAEALAAQRRRDEHVGVVHQPPLLLVADAADDVDAGAVEQVRLDLLGRRAGDGQAGSDAGGAQRLEGAQRDGQALALLGAAEEQQPHVVGLGLRALDGRRGVDPVGHDPVAAAVEALGGPARGLGHGELDVGLVVEPPGAQDGRGQVARELVGGVGVDGGDERPVPRLGGQPGDDRRVDLVHVHDVVAAVLQLLRQERGPVGESDRRDWDPFIGSATRAAQRYEVIGQGPGIRPTTVDQAGKTVIRVVGRKNAHVVPFSQELLGESLDVSPHSPRISSGIGGYQCNAHPRRVTAFADACRPIYVRYRTMQGRCPLPRIGSRLCPGHGQATPTLRMRSVCCW